MYDSLDSAWYLRSVPRVAQFTWVVDDPARRQMAEQAVDRFTREVMPLVDHLPQGERSGSARGMAWCSHWPSIMPMKDHADRNTLFLFVMVVNITVAINIMRMLLAVGKVIDD